MIIQQLMLDKENTRKVLRVLGASVVDEDVYLSAISASLFTGWKTRAGSSCIQVT